MAKILCLKPDGKLLNPSFDGYKLCCDADITVYSKPVHEGLQSVGSGSVCYLGTHLNALHNHLISDPFHPTTVYYFTKRGQLVKLSYSEDLRLSSGEVVWQAELPQEDITGSQASLTEDSEGIGLKYYHAAVYFPSAELAVASNGCGTIQILRTQDRTPYTSHSWLVNFECKIARGLLLQAQLNSEKSTLDCLVLSITHPKELKANSEYVINDEQLENTSASSLHLLNWITLSQNDSVWKISSTRVVAGEGIIQYAYIDSSAENLMILANNRYSFVYDSQSPITKEEKQEKNDLKMPKFIYMQSDEDITIWLSVGEAAKNDITVKALAKELSIKLKGAELLKGELFAGVQAELTTWTLSDGRLEIVLSKGTVGQKWDNLLIGGQSVGEEVKEQPSTLAHLTSDKWNPNPEPDHPVYNPGQLEGCDEASEELTLRHLSLSTHKLSATCNLGLTQHLFNAQIESTGPPGFCLRHDVDGVLWQPRSNNSYTHLTTYDAFGYVRASKTEAKFTCASQDLSYVAVADTRSHIYIFYQPGIVGSGEIRNRKSGRCLGKVARQFVISLPTHDFIMGLYALQGLLFVLTQNTIYLYALPTS